jgi:hypothetical protein
MKLSHLLTSTEPTKRPGLLATFIGVVVSGFITPFLLNRALEPPPYLSLDPSSPLFATQLLLIFILGFSAFLSYGLFVVPALLIERRYAINRITYFALIEASFMSPAIIKGDHLLISMLIRGLGGMIFMSTRFAFERIWAKSSPSP